MSQRVSIHICTRDRFLELSNLLQSLDRQTYTDFDLVLVDGSQPNPIVTHKVLLDMINRLRVRGHEVIYVRDEFNMGVCHARNLAIQHDTTENPLLLRIDDDSICEPDYVEKLVRMMEDPNVGAAGGVVPLYGTEPIYRSSENKTLLNAFVLNQDGDILLMGDEAWARYTPDKIIPAHHLRSSFIWRRELVEKIAAKFGFGGFATDYGKVGFREESDYCLKILALGYKLLIDTSAVCWHVAATSGGTRRPDYADQVAIADAHFKRKVKWWYNAGLLPQELCPQLGKLGAMKLG